MSFALTELRRLLQQDDALIGVVLSIDGALVRIATAKGAVVASAAMALATGDRVLIRAGIAGVAPAAIRSYSV